MKREWYPSQSAVMKLKAARWSAQETHLDALWQIQRTRRRAAALLAACQPVPLLVPTAFPSAASRR